MSKEHAKIVEVLLERAIKEPLAKTKKLEKGLKNHLAALAMSAGTMMSPVAQHLQQQDNLSRASAPKFTGQDLGYHAGSYLKRANEQMWDKPTTLKAFVMQETSGGKSQNHREIKSGLNAGSHAFGKYGLTHLAIKEMVQKHPDLKEHSAMLNMEPKDVNNYMSTHPGLEDKVASHYYDSVAKAVGSKKPSILYHAWLNGPTGTKKYMQTNNVDNHPIAAKVQKYYDTLSKK